MQERMSTTNNKEAAGDDGAAPAEAALEIVAPGATVEADGGSEYVSLDTFGLPNAAAPSISGGIADDEATIDVSHMTDDFGGATGVVSQVAGGVSEEEGDGVLPSPPVPRGRDGDGRTEVMKGDISDDGDAERPSEMGAFGLSAHDATPPNSGGNADDSAKTAIPHAAPSSAGEGVPFADNLVVEGATNATNIEEHLSPHSIPGVMFVPGPGFRGGIHTGYRSAQESDDDNDIENQTTLIEANPVPDEDEAAEIIDALQAQIESAQQELQVAQSQVAQSKLPATAVLVESNGNQLIKHDDDAKEKGVIMWLVLILGMIAVVVGLAVSFATNRAAGVEVEGNEDLNQQSAIMESYSLIHLASKVGEEKNEMLGTSNAITANEFLVSGSPGVVGGGDEIGEGKIFNLTSLVEGVSSTNKTNTTEASNSNTTISITTNIITNSTSGDRCGAAVTATALGRHYAIGCPSTTGLGYVQVFEWDFTSSPPKQVGITLYGKEIDDGFGVNIALSQRPPGRDDLRLAIGSNSGYAQLWDIVDGLWHRLDDKNGGDGGFLNHPEGKAGGEVTVSLPGSPGFERNLFVGYPSFDSDRGIVRIVVVGGNTGNVSLTERFDGDIFLQGSRQGDRFGTDIDTDIEGKFVAIGAGGGGYVRAISFYANTSSEEVKVRPVGSEIRLNSNDGEEESSIGSRFDFGSSVATGRVPYRGCPRCGFVLNGRRVAVGSSTGFYVFQFVEDESRWYQIAEHASDSGMVEVSMSPDTVYLGVGTPSAGNGRGFLDIYKILDQEGDLRKGFPQR